MDLPLLLHSLAEFRELVVACLDASGAKSVVEIGSEDGTFTRELLAWAADADAHVYCIDPSPTASLVDLVAGSPRADLLLQRSVEALEHLAPCHAYFIDGDHNYYTVIRELRLIAAGGCPLIFLHDVGWPAGRRDMYYSPETIPPDERHDYTYDKGAVPWRSELVQGGFRGEGQFAWALHDGGPRNGVVTAVEDFLRGRSDVALVTVPCIFGLAVVYPKSAPWAGTVSAILAGYDGDALLRRLEDNRLRLYLRLVQAQDDMTELHRQLEKSSLHIRDVEVENRALWARVSQLEEQLQLASRSHEELIDEVRKVLRSRSVAVAEGLSQFHGRLTHRPSLSCERLRGLVEEDAR